jgi:uncharacterized membrane protein (UPF0127 family)
MTTITQYTLKLIKNLILTTALFGKMAYAKELFKMQNQNGILIELDLALTRDQHTKGLSGLKSNQFKDSKGMLFVNSAVGPRRFWMPNTYFNLDIIFLDQNLKISGIEKNVPAHPGHLNPEGIYQTKTYNAQFVLEIKTGAAFGTKLKMDDQLKFIGPTSLSEIALKTRLLQ